ncbi:hypothetical protein, partial [Microbispora corallina]
MADRTVTVKLWLDNKDFITGLAKAEAAAKRFRDSLEGLSDPFKNLPKELPLPKVPKDRPTKDGDAAAGAFARSFTRRLEAAFRSLPKAEITASSTDAQAKVQTLRAALQDLAGKTINVDIDAATALAELQAIKSELETVDSSADIDLRVDTSAALTEIAALQAEVDRFNTDQAQSKLDDLRARLDSLRGRTIGVDLDAGAAKAELSEIQRQLEALNRSSANPQVQVDSARALADLRTLQSELNQTGGRTARPRVDADVSGALRNIALVAAALASLPVATTVGIAAAAFGAAGAGAAGFAAVAVPALGRVNDALQQQQSASGGAGGAAESLASKQARAASTALQLAEAQDRVKDAQDAVRQAQQQVADAVEQSAERQATAARRIEDAERSVADSHRATQRAVEDLTRAREEAQQRLEDLALATEGGALAEERARISLARAQSDLARANANPATSQLDRQDAALRVREAEFALKSVQARNAQLAKEQADANAKGVEGSDQVRAAKDNVASATQREQDAERNLSDARAEAAKAAIEGQRAIAKAQADVLKAQRDAERAAQRLKVEQLQAKAAMQQTGGAAGGAASKMSQLSKREQDLAKHIKGYQDAYLAWQRSLEGDVFPAITGGLDLIQSQLPRISPLVRTAGRSFVDFEKDAATALNRPIFDQLLFDLNTAMPRAIEGLGNTGLNVMTGLAGVFDAFLPHTGAVVGSIETASKKFADWGTSLRTNQDFQKFLDYVSQNGPKVMGILGDLGSTVGHILAAGAGAGETTLDVLVSISDRLAHMSPEQIQAIAAGVGAVVGAAKLGSALKLGAWVILADLISGMSPGEIRAVAGAIAAVVAAVKLYQTAKGVNEWLGGLSIGFKKAGDAADKARVPLAGAGSAAERAAGGFSGLGGTLKGGAIALGVGAVAGAATALRDRLSGLNPDIHTLAQNIAAVADGGRPTPELLNQINGKVSALDPSQWESFGQIASRLTSDNTFAKLGSQVNDVFSTTFGVNLDSGLTRIQNIDKGLAQAVSSGHGDAAAKMFDQLAKMAHDAGVPLDKLKTLFPEYTSAVSGAVGPTNDAAGAIDGARQKLDDFQSSMDVFAGRTDAESALAGLKRGYDDAKKAIEAAGGKLDFFAGMTDKQRDAIIRARGGFSDFISQVTDAAKKQADLGKKTGDAALGVDKQKLVILQALPQLFNLAGKSKEARDAIFRLGESAGLSKDQMVHAKDAVAKLRLEIARLQSKVITVTVKAGNGQKSNNPGTSRDFHADGAVVEYYAAGGLREAHIAQIAPRGNIR